MSAEVLRRAASLIRERAEAATPGPWEPSVWDSGHSRYEMNASVITAEHGDRICDMDGLGRSSNEVVAKDDGCADAYHIASWHPAVALAVADWLTYVADTHDETACPAMSAAEQVARAYLGESA